MKISDFKSLRRFFRKIKRPVIGAGVYAFDRLGPEDFIPQYQILSLRSSEETKLIRRDVPVFCLEEKIKKGLRPRNASTLISHHLTQKYLSRFKEPLILFYKSSQRIEETAKNLRFKIGVAPYRFGRDLFENKAKFRRILQKIGVSSTPGKILSPSFFYHSTFSEFKKEFGLPFVVQHPSGGGGKGTFFINNEADLEKANKSIKEFPPKEIIVAKFVKGPSPSVTGCVTKFGVLSTRPQYQIYDIPLLYSRPVGSGLFCGHDWSASIFSGNVLRQVREAVERIGLYFKKLGYRGVFGVDFVQDAKKDKIYVTECNPRMLGSMPTLTMVEAEKNIPPIMAFHILEYLNTPYEIDKKKIESLLWQKVEGSQMLLCNSSAKEVVQNGEMKPGIYKLVDEKKQWEKLRFIRPAYKFSQLRDKSEILISEGLQKKGARVYSYQRLARIILKERVLDADLGDITPSAKKVINLVSKEIKVN
ncbi:MAG: ATP-grasp domain-containing protein [Patescibacteria group bacterium]